MEILATATDDSRPTSSSSRTLLASSKHLVIFLVIVLGLAVAGALNGASSHTAEATPEPMTLAGAFLFMIAMQWLWLRFVQQGMRRQGRSVWEFIGQGWATPRVVATDVVYAGLAAALIYALSAVATRLLHVARPELGGLAPTGIAQSVLWVAMAVTAGVCEETIFRGYLKGQLVALSGNATVAVLGQAVLFGLAHSYQGFGAAGIITLVGLVLGALATWRGNIRACIIAHAAVDILAGVSGY
jgi:membrane protease YdiL (CAAX protease family)